MLLCLLIFPIQPTTPSPVKAKPQVLKSTFGVKIFIYCNCSVVALAFIVLACFSQALAALLSPFILALQQHRHPFCRSLFYLEKTANIWFLLQSYKSTPVEDPERKTIRGIKASVRCDPWGFRVSAVNAASAYHVGGGFKTGGRHALEDCHTTAEFDHLAASTPVG